MSDFDRFANDYRTIHDANLKGMGYSSDYFSARKIREIARHTKGADYKLKVLDLGCGDGLCCHYLRKYFSDADIYGIDISMESLIAAGNRNIPRAYFSLYDGLHIPFQNNFFHIVLMANVLHHVYRPENQTALLRECRRVLMKKSNLFIFEHNPLNPITRRLVNDCPFDQDAVLVHFRRLKKILTQAGFSHRFRFFLFLPGIFNKFEFIEKWLWWLPIGGQYYFICQKKSNSMQKLQSIFA